jgi:hypothetical protein
MDDNDNAIMRPADIDRVAHRVAHIDNTPLS